MKYIRYERPKVKEKDVKKLAKELLKEEKKVDKRYYAVIERGGRMVELYNNKEKDLYHDVVILKGYEIDG